MQFAAGTWQGSQGISTDNQIKDSFTKAVKFLAFQRIPYPVRYFLKIFSNFSASHNLWQSIIQQFESCAVDKIFKVVLIYKIWRQSVMSEWTRSITPGKWHFLDMMGNRNVLLYIQITINELRLGSRDYIRVAPGKFFKFGHQTPSGTGRCFKIRWYGGGRAGIAVERRRPTLSRRGSGGILHREIFRYWDLEMSFAALFDAKFKNLTRRNTSKRLLKTGIHWKHNGSTIYIVDDTYIP